METNTLQFTICNYNCLMPCQSLCWCLRHNYYDKIYFHEKLAHQITAVLYKCQWIFDLIRVFSIRCLTKWVMNGISISRCLVCYPFNQIYTTKVCCNCPCAVIKFVELQVRIFFSFIIIFRQIFSDNGLSKPTCDK